MPGKFGRPCQHSSLQMPRKLKNQILTSKISHQQFIFLSWKSEAESGRGWKKMQGSSWWFLNWKRKLLYWRKKDPDYSGNKVQEKSQSYWTTQQVPNLILSFKFSWLLSWIDMPQAAHWGSNKPSPPCLLDQRLITGQTWSDSHCSRWSPEGNIKKQLHLREHCYLITQSFLLPLHYNHRETSFILQSSFQQNFCNTRWQLYIYSIMPKSRISGITVLFAYSCAYPTPSFEAALLALCIWEMLSEG